MAHAGRDDLPVREIAPGYSSRFADWDGMTVGFEFAPAGMDASTMLDGLPDGRCHAPHWGVLLSGHILVDYGDRQEEIVGGQAYYVEPGHRISFLEDSEAVEFTPTADLEKTFEIVRRNAAAAAGGAA
ncbi:hypothetical protein Gocc_0314 [Gaiella occulta]|uniref:Cupin domain-containing protein n=1 Tax=Gaiella occulta TaxID=1002870 RepID=A0A7M2Z1I4_9ACTN|nr:hypothetical protein [Gaiella occulta]RDI75895.1 hypothetical protein Gocc_0314 [Gaiella occulta]